MNDSRLTKIIGALVFLFVFAVYFVTMAPTTSFWDCGEFIACSYTMGVPHPPGSPLFIMLGRVFSLVPFETAFKAVGFPPYTDIAARVNFMSPITGALAALFCYLVILRLIRGWRDGRSPETESLSAHAGAVVGALIFAYADSNWFNAVEAEVYAYAIFLMMLALYLGLLWADTVGKAIHVSLALFLAYLMGLAGGLHLLALLVVPSIALLGLFSYVKDRRDAWVILGTIVLLGLGGYFGLHALNAARLIADQNAEPASTYGISDDAVVYQQLAVALAVLFGVGGLVLSFFTRTVRRRDMWAVLLVGVAALATVNGAIDVFFYSQGVGEFPWVMLAAGIVSGVGLIVLSQGTKRLSFAPLRGYHFTVGLLLLVVVGYSTYLVLMVRSGLDPSIDENNPENWKNLFAFIAREQYGTEDMSLVIFNRRASMDFQFWDMFVKYLFQQFPASITGALLDVKIYFRSAMESSMYGMRVPDLPLILAALGIIWHYDNDRKRFLAVLALFIISGLGLAVYLNMPDPQPRERHYVFTGATSMLAIWMGMGVTGLIRAVRDLLPSRLPQYAVAALGLAVPLWFLVGYPLVDEFSADQRVRYTNWARHDRTDDTIAYDYAYNILQSCDPYGVLFTNGDNDTFPLWYVQEVAGVRKDVRVINLSLLNTDWYIEQLRDYEPRIPMGEGYTDEYIQNVLCGATLESLVQSGRVDVGPDGSPFNEQGNLIGWRTKQVGAASADTGRIVLADGRVLRGVVRDSGGGRIEVLPERDLRWQSFPRSAVARIDEEKSFSIVRLALADGRTVRGIPRDVGSDSVSVLPAPENPWEVVQASDVVARSVGDFQLRWELPAPPDYRILRVQDVMVYNIVHWVSWERPVYFAVTVSNDNKLGLDRYLEMEGMVFRVIRETGRDFNVDRSIHNLEQVYLIRNVDNPEVYKDDNMLKLLSNYRSAYLQLADKEIAAGSLDRARWALSRMNDRLPLDWRAAYSAASIARQGGPALASIVRAYANAAADILDRELVTLPFDSYQIEKVRYTAQILRMANEDRRAMALLDAANLQSKGSSSSTGSSSVERLLLLLEMSRAYEDSGDYSRAKNLLVEARAMLVEAGRDPAVAGRFREQFSVDPGLMIGDVDRQIVRLAAQSSDSGPGADTARAR